MNDLRKAAEQALEALESWQKTCLDCGRASDELGRATAPIQALRQALDDKPAVKSYCGGKPNYCTPEVTPDVDAVNMSQDRVDETVKSEQEPWPSVQCVCGGAIYFKYTKREWVGLTDEEMRTLKQKSVDDGMTRIVSDFEYIRSIEAKLREKNSG